MLYGFPLLDLICVACTHNKSTPTGYINTTNDDQHPINQANDHAVAATEHRVEATSVHPIELHSPPQRIADLPTWKAGDRLSPIDIVAVLTKAVQEQQRIMQEQQQTIAALAEEVGALKVQHKL